VATKRKTIMSELKLTGTIKLVNELQTFDSGFVKREFVITTNEQYPQDVKFEVVKDKATDFDKFNKVGDVVDVKFNVRGNEYNSKYYVNLQAWYIAKADGANAPTKQEVGEVIATTEEDDLPF